MHLFCNLESRAGTHAVLVIGLYELLGNPTTPTTYLIEPPGTLSVEYMFGLVLLCLTSLLAIFQLYRGGHIHWQTLDRVQTQNISSESRLITGFVARLTRWVPLVEQELLTLQ